MSSLKTWVMASRPKTLPAAVVPVWIGSALVALDQSGQYHFSGRLFLYTLLSCLLIQIATNFYNDAIDFDKGDTVALDQSGQYHFSGRLFLYTLLSCLLIQIATNFYNDAIDFDKGADTDKRLGPRRVTASGLVSRKQVMAAGVVASVLAGMVGVPLMMERGWPITLIGGYG